METITLKINNRTKTGKTLLSLLEIFSKDKKAVEIIASEKKKAEKKPNAETLRAMENVEKGKNTKSFNSVDELIAELNS